MKLIRLPFILMIGILLLFSDISAQTTVQIGSGSSSSSTRGPFQRADTNSTTVFSRWVMVYTAAELSTAGLTSGNAITELAWELASSNIIVGSGNANLKIYIKNSSATAAMSDTWANHIAGSTLAFDQNFNTTNYFPGANGWMPFTFNGAFSYTGGAIEIAVDWDCSQVSTPAFSGNEAIKFRWESTSPDDLVVKKTSSSSPSTTISDLKDERANIQITYVAGTCPAPTNLNASNMSTSGADFNWTAATGASTYNWKVVPVGASSTSTAVDSGNTAMTMANTSGLMTYTTYDLYVQTDCETGTSTYAGPFTFTTLPPSQATIAIGAGSSSSSTRGPFQRSDTNSSTVFSRFVHIYSASELAAADITNGMDIREIQWELASSNVVIGSGDATLKVYVKNSSATAAVSDTWANHISGSTLAVDRKFNTTNNFPGANGWMEFPFSSPFTYTGGALEIAVDWDCSQVSTPAFSGDGALKWRWEATPFSSVVKKTSSSSPSSTITDVKTERANIQMLTAVLSVPDTVNVTFSVDMTQYGASFNTVYISGEFNGWSANANPLTDQGNGVWSTTMAIDTNSSNFYKFQLDSWSVQEGFGPNDNCAANNNGNYDRLLTVAFADVTLPTYCWSTCNTNCSVPADSVNITFLVNTANITVDPTGLFLAGGGNFGNPGDNPMSDADGDGVYEITVRKQKGFGSYYIFTNGNAGWGNKEDLTGLPCGDPNNFNDRTLPGVYSDTTLMTCYETCATDTVCTLPPATIDLTLSVDLSEYTSTVSGVNVFGTFNSWSNTSNPMTDQGNGIWQTTITVNENDSIEYKFVVDSSGTLMEEIFTGGESCTKTTGNFTNRFLALGNTNTTADTVCWESCAACISSNVNQLLVDNNLFTIQPNITSDVTTIHFANNVIMEEKVINVYNAFGQLVLTETANNTNVHRLDLNNFASGMYFINVQSQNKMATKRLVIQK